MESARRGRFAVGYWELQLPNRQSCPMAQVFPQEPQLGTPVRKEPMSDRSTMYSTHDPLEQHSGVEGNIPPEQVSPAAPQPQLPLKQVKFAPMFVQEVPQEPQLLLSLLVSVQVPLQQSCPKLQGPAPPQEHVPALHVSPWAQPWLQPPQWSGSVFVSSHPVPQQTRSPVHSAPPAQVQ